MKLKEWFIRFYYLNIYETIYSVWYSIKQLGNSFVELIESFKHPDTWNSIMYVIVFYAVLTRNTKIVKWSIPIIITIYIIRQRIAGGHHVEIRERALRSNNQYILKDEYNKYTRDCYFKKIKALDLLASYLGL